MRGALLVATAAALVTACGGGNPFDNPEDVSNPAATEGRRLSFAYFQVCIHPVLTQPVSGSSGSNTCAAGGCHDSVTGTGGALRLDGSATAQDLAQTPEQIRASAMYRNFFSAQGVTVIGNAAGSLLLAKPRLANVLHGGGLIFDGESEGTRRLAFWITRPMPPGQDEFSSAGLALLDAQGGCSAR